MDTDPAKGAISTDIDIFATDIRLDPYPVYKKLRHTGPVIWLEKQGFYLLTGYDDTKKALTDWRNFSSAGGVAMNDNMNEKLSGGLLCSDPPRHDALRKVIERPLTPRALSDLRERISSEAKTLVARLVKQGSFDAATELAQHLPLTIVSDLVGLPEEGRDRMLAWAPANFDCIGPDTAQRTHDAMPIVGEMVEYAFTQCVPGKLKPGGWAQMIWDAAHAGEVDLEDAPFMMNDYMGPSLDTTIFATSWIIWLFAQHPDQWDKLRENPKLIPAAINEALRIKSPIHHFSRYVAQDVEISGVTLPKGARVVISYCSANMDETKWGNPEEFDIQRPGSNEHLAFGFGEHNCVGQNLARLEIRALLSELVPQVERFELLAAQPAQNNILYGLKSCRVKVH